MKKIIFFISLIFLSASTTKAQTDNWRGGYEELLDEQDGVTANGKWWKTDDCSNFNLIQAGHRCDPVCNGYGFFVGYKHGWNITAKPLYIEPGLEFHYMSMGWRGSSIGLTTPIDFSYKFKIGDFYISPITGPTLGWIHYMYDWYWSGQTDDDFAFGWDFGVRFAYRRFTLSYRFNKVLNDCAAWNSHSLGIGFTF
jgi:hypothetical protein